MIADYLKPEVIDFIIKNENVDVNQLLLKHRQYSGVPINFIADQIKGRNKAKYKLPGYYNNHNIIYPPSLNLEQSSSEQTAQYKVDLLRNFFSTTQKIGVDLTGGFGVDSYFISKCFQQYYHVEPDENLIEIARHNHQAMGASNILYHPATAERFLEETSQTFDFIYVDPSRRISGNRKVFTLQDCEPDIVSLLNVMFEKTGLLMIKTSPLLDISEAIKNLRHVKAITVVSVDNEVKELLFVSEKHFADEPQLEAVNIKNGITETFIFRRSDELAVNVDLSPVLNYLYEPNASILKAGAFKTIAQKFEVFKLHPNTHFYTSKHLIHDFPGRIFEVIALSKPDKKSLASFFPHQQANVITRNYPLSPEELKLKTGLKDGGDLYLLAFTDMNAKALAVASRIK